MTIDSRGVWTSRPARLPTSAPTGDGDESGRRRDALQTATEEESALVSNSGNGSAARLAEARAPSRERQPDGQRRMSVPATARLPRLVLGSVVAVLTQTGIGMVVNLYTTIPAHHPGANPSNYLAGSARSIGWAISHAAVALAIHATLGLVVVVLAITVAVTALRGTNRALKIWSILAAGLVIGAGFNGASFLDFNKNTSSLVMALLALGSVACYSIALFSLTVAA